MDPMKIGLRFLPSFFVCFFAGGCRRQADMRLLQYNKEKILYEICFYAIMNKMAKYRLLPILAFSGGNQWQMN